MGQSVESRVPQRLDDRTLIRKLNAYNGGIKIYTFGKENKIIRFFFVCLSVFFSTKCLSLGKSVTTVWYLCVLIFLVGLKGALEFAEPEILSTRSVTFRIHG